MTERESEMPWGIAAWLKPDTCESCGYEFGSYEHACIHGEYKMARLPGRDDGPED